MFNQTIIFMRKFTLLVAALVIGAMTQVNAERKWNFTDWSAETVANLKAANANGGDWSDDEKDNGNATGDKCFWQVDATADVNADGYLTANGVVIKELEGLKYTNTTKNRSLAIAVDYPSTSIGTYHGGAYLWLGASDINYFVIPDVKPGSTIVIGLESHKNSDARGVKLYVGAGTDGAELKDLNGNEVAVPTTYQDQVWAVPADAASTDIQIVNTNGCHLYYINVADPGETAGVANIAVAESENAPIYNLQGVQVDENYKGIVIKNGKKYINK